MSQAKTKSRTFRRVKKGIPGSAVAIHFSKKRPKKARCAGCGSLLHGTKPLSPKMLAKLPKSQKRPERAFGGVFCSKCAREALKARARK